MIDTLEHVDLSEMVADNQDCRARGCLTTTMSPSKYVFVDDEDGEEILVEQWVIRHATAEKYATIPVSYDVVEDAGAWPGVLVYAIKEAHGAMDSLGSKPA